MFHKRGPAAAKNRGRLADVGGKLLDTSAPGLSDTERPER